MNKPFDPRVLFEPAHDRSTYDSDASELDAVRRRKKAISMFVWSREDLATREFKRFTDLVLDRELAMVLEPGEEHDLYCFVLYRDQAWRISALRALWQTAAELGAWTDTAEAQMGELLGYSARERRRWLAEQHWRQPAWGCSTVYALATRDMGPRGLGVETMFFAHADHHVMKRNAASLAPDGTVIVRVGLEPRFARGFHGAKPRHRIVSGTIPARRMKRFHAAMRSSVQVLGPKGWS